jgi:hypothetical protein
MTMETQGWRPWSPYIAVGTGLLIVGGIIGGAAYPRTSSDGTTSGSTALVVFGSIIGAVGFAVLLVGLIALGVNLAQRNPVEPAAGFGRPQPAEPTSGAPQTDPADLRSDPDPFAPHRGDSLSVAEVRRACEFGASQTALRRLVNKSAREGRMTDQDRAMAEALLIEARRRPMGRH